MEGIKTKRPMKKLLIFLFTVISFAALGQAGSLSQSVYRSRVNDSTSVTTPAGYGLLYYNNQRSTPAWLFSNDQGATWHELGSGSGGPVDISDVTGLGANVETALGVAAGAAGGFLRDTDLMTSRTLTGADDLDQTDNLRIVYANSASPFDITVDLLTAGSQVTVINIGSATVTLIEGSGVTLPGTTVDIAAGENAVIIYRVAATPEVYTGSSSLNIGSTAISGGTSGRILYNNAGVLGEYPVGTGVATWLATPSWTNFNSAITGTAPYVPLTGSAALTGNVELTGGHKIGLSNSAASLGIGVAPGSITANTAFEIVSGNDTHAIFRNSSTSANNIQLGVLSGVTPQAMFTVGANNTKMYQSGSSFRTEASGTLIYYASTTTFQNAASTFGIQNSPNANVDNAVIPFSIFAGGVSTSAATQAMGGDLYFKGRFWNGSANVSRGFYFHPQASTSNNLEGNLRLYTDIAGGTSVEIMRFDQAGNANVATNLHIGSTSVTNASAVAEVSSTTKGFLPPRMTTTQKNAISSPAAGLMVFDTDLAKMCFYNGSAWETITSAP